MRIASLHPAATEMVAALGLMDSLVARSHECDFPAGVQALPALTRSRVEDPGSSRAIDDAVRTLSASGPLYPLDAEGLRDLRPDFVLAQKECALCALDASEVETLVAAWPEPRPRVLVSGSPASASAMGAELLDLGRALGVEEAAYAALMPLLARLGAMWELCCLRASRKPRTLVLEWLDPPMPCGSWLPRLVEEAGGEPVLWHPGGRAVASTWDAILASDPDVVVVAACGFPVARTLREWDVLERNAAFRKLRAWSGGRVYVADGNAYFNRPGPRLVDSVEILVRALHPTLADEAPGLTEGMLWDARRAEWVT